MLMRRWERARQGDGQMVMIVGEPGLGQVAADRGISCPLARDPAYLGRMELLATAPEHASASDQRNGAANGSAVTTYPLSNASRSWKTRCHRSSSTPLKMPPPCPTPRYSAAERSAPTSAPEELRRRQLAALIAWVLAGARAQPGARVEDAHWADPTTLDLLRGIAERGALAPLFVLITARPDFRPPWGMRSHHSLIALAPLDRQQVRHMVGGIAARHALAKEMVEGVTERTGGVPLFVEEVTRLLLERGEQGGTQAIPPTLQQSLTARLDRLGPAREVAQIGAVVGRDFSYALLRAVAGMEDTPLQAALDRLAEADILLVQGLPPESDYRFKHALIQDAAYENLLKSRRQVLHRRVAETLRDRFPARAAAEPELLAHHFAQAGFSEAAIEWWGKAGQRSLERSALAEAVEQFTRALSQIATLPSTPTLRREEIKLQVALIHPLIHLKGHAAPETKAAAERARLLIEQAEALGESPEDPLLLFSALGGLAAASFVAFDGDAVRQLAARIYDARTQARGHCSAHARAFLRGHALSSIRATSQKVGPTSTGRLHFTIPLSTVRRQPGSPQTPECMPCAIGHGPIGFLATQRPRFPTRVVRSATPARSARLPC